jgi:hypothetical protein
MTLHITRREALRVAIAGAMVPTLLPGLELPESEFVNVDDYTPKPYGDCCEWTPAQVCHVFAAWELSAQQFNLPHKWRTLRYDGAFQWNDGEDGRVPLIAWYGIGPAAYTAQRMDELIEFINGEGRNQERRLDVLAYERIARGRAFAIVSAGLMSPRLRHELSKPAWKRDRTICV